MIRAFWFALFLLPAVLSGVQAQSPAALSSSWAPPVAASPPPSGGHTWGPAIVLGSIRSGQVFSYTNTGTLAVVLFGCNGTDTPGVMPSAVVNSCAPIVQRGGFVTPGFPGVMTAEPEPDYTIAPGASGVGRFSGSRTSPPLNIFSRTYVP